MNLWHMQLHPNEHDDWSKHNIMDFPCRYGVIGLGAKWDGEHGQPGLNLEQFKKFLVPIPSKPEQTAIANVLSSMDKEIEALNTKLEKYRNLKTGMMQQLLTGKIRLG